MRLLHRERNVRKLAVETADDLWYLYTLLDPGDVCTGQSEYKMKLQSGEKTKSARKRVWVRLQVIKSEFDTDRLRISGSVLDGSEEVPRGSHHSLDLHPGDSVTLEKERWLGYQKEKLQEALHAGSFQTLLVLFDRERALFVLLKPNGHETLLEIQGNVPRKGLDEQKTRDFYGEIVSKLEQYDQRHEVERIVAASPAFWKEYLRKVLPPELQEKTIFAAVSAVDESAVAELLGREEVKQALAHERAAKETALVEEMMAALAKDRLAYGLDDIGEAIRNGNVKTLAVTESQIRKAREEDAFDGLERLMRSAEDAGATLHLLSTEEAMRKLDGLGGIAGVRRW